MGTNQKICQYIGADTAGALILPEGLCREKS